MRMSAWTEMVFILVVVLDFFLLASSRLKAVIRAAAAQGALLAVMPLLLAWHTTELGHVLALSIGALVVKGVVIPWLLLWAIREAAIRREVEPIVGFIPSLILGGLGVALAFAFSSAMPLPDPREARLHRADGALDGVDRAPAGRAARKAVSQVIGFLVLENGVFVFGLLLSDFMPTMVEAGVLLDLFAAVFVMGIVMFHINREFSSLDTEKLSVLKD